MSEAAAAAPDGGVPLRVDGVRVHPAYLHVPPRAGSAVDQVLAVAALAGRSHEPEQVMAIDVLCGRRGDGRPAARTGVVVCARQNLKTYCLESLALHRLLDPSLGPQLIIWTAQRLTATEETYRHLMGMLDSDERPALRKRVRRASASKGFMEIEMVSGSRIKFMARSAKSGPSLTGDLVVLDEAFAVEADHLGALLPTLSTRPHAQILWGSSAPHAGSVELRRVMERGRRGGPGAPAYVEWCAAGSWVEPPCVLGVACTHELGKVSGCALDDREQVRAANPLAGVRLDWEVLDDERRDLSPRMFARERLGWGEDPAVAGRPPITIDAWRRLIDPESSPVGQVCMAVEISQSREWSSITVAGYRADGSRHLGLVDRRPGTEWLLPRLLGLAARPDLASIDRGSVGRPRFARAIAVDPMSPAAPLIERLRLAGVEVVVMSTREVGAACSTLQDAVAQGDVWHHGSPDVEDALRGAVRRDIGEGQWAFGRARSARRDVEIDPIVGAANALWLADLVGRGYDVSASIY